MILDLRALSVSDLAKNKTDQAFFHFSLNSLLLTCRREARALDVTFENA